MTLIPPISYSTATNTLTLSIQRIAKIFAQSLQRYNFPADWARKLFKLSTDLASRLVQIEKNCSLWVYGSLGEDVTSGGVIFILLA